ncbi:hypothetical protein [Haloglycomyces albus]|uniref:hypothetical protein n=1 Tax=Haloglycomyces albus TaxID=526067 RepID=UPI0004B33EC3|nr:hypothetical protein [Haloglycomyces albus]
MTDSNNAEHAAQHDFDQSDVWQRLESAIDETLAVFPERPEKFESRILLSFDDTCAHHNHAQYELRYRFTLDDSRSTAVRLDNYDALHAKWALAGFNVHGVDEPSGKLGADRNIQGLRESDAVNVWYRVWGQVSILAQTRCINKVDNWNPPCPEPLRPVERDIAYERYCEG